MENATKKYAFVLGREQDLCLAELRSVLTRFCFNPEQNGDRSGRTGFDFSILSVSKNIVFINLDSSPSDLIGIVGGTTKIFEIIPQQKDLKKQIKELIAERSENAESKFNFGFSTFCRRDFNTLNSIGLSIKKEMKATHSLRFIMAKEPELTTIVSSKNNLATKGLEIGIFDNTLGILIAVTDPEEWSVRDYEKPASDKHSGMLPPKLARIMLNLALGEASRISYNVSGITELQRETIVEKAPDQTLKIENCKNENSQATLVVDPFCGSGNVVLEAMMLGCDIFGSDVSEKAVEDTRENVEWLNSRGVIPTEAEGSFNNKISPTVRQSLRSRNDNIEIIHSDATGPELLSALSLKLSAYDSLVVVAEPYLGEPKKYTPSLNAARGEYAKVKELYLNFLTNFAKLTTYNLQLPVVLCLVFPLVETADGERYSLYAESVDEIRKIGYTELKLPLVYGRDYQVVKRQICLLQIPKHQDTNIK